MSWSTELKLTHYPNLGEVAVGEGDVHATELYAEEAESLLRAVGEADF